MDRMSSDAALRFVLFAHCSLWPLYSCDLACYHFLNYFQPVVSGDVCI
jgi:hypothetical protein